MSSAEGLMPERIRRGDHTIALQRWGDPRRPVVVLVHGYPDDRSIWAPMARLLADEFHVVAYDVRGAGGSGKPWAKRQYALAELSADFRAVIEHVSPGRAVHVVAHDWGSVQSWESVTDPGLKGRIASYTSCSGPCLDHMGHWIRHRLQHPSWAHSLALTRQLLKSWYVYLFHLPAVPEFTWRHLLAPQWPTLMRWLEGVRIQPRPTQGEDGAHGVNLYRANVFPRLKHPRERVAHAPVQVIVPLRDHFISPALSLDLARWAPGYVRKEIDAGHWVTVQEPGRFAQLVLAFIDRVEARSPVPTPPVHAAS